MGNKRGFYRIAPGALRKPSEDDAGVTLSGMDSVEVGRTTTYVYVFSGLNPNERLEAAGGEKLGDNWNEFRKSLTVGTANKIFMAECEFDETDEDGKAIKVTRNVPRRDAAGASKTIDDWIPPVAFSAAESVQESGLLGAHLVRDKVLRFADITERGGRRALARELGK